MTIGLTFDRLCDSWLCIAFELGVGFENVFPYLQLGQRLGKILGILLVDVET